MSKFKDDKCFIETHTSLMPALQQCNGAPVTYFEDFTDNHNKTLIQIEYLQLVPLALANNQTETLQQNSLPVTVTVFMDTRDGKTIERTIPVNPDPSISVERAFQVEDLCRISVRCDCGGLGPFVTFDLNIEKTFCICCPEENNDSHNCDRCGSQDKCECASNRYYHSFYVDY